MTQAIADKLSGMGVIIAILDSGLGTVHEDLASNVLPTVPGIMPTILSIRRLSTKTAITEPAPPARLLILYRSQPAIFIHPQRICAKAREAFTSNLRATDLITSRSIKILTTHVPMKAMPRCPRHFIQCRPVRTSQL